MQQEESCSWFPSVHGEEKRQEKENKTIKTPTENKKKKAIVLCPTKIATEDSYSWFSTPYGKEERCRKMRRKSEQ